MQCCSALLGRNPRDCHISSCAAAFCNTCSAQDAIESLSAEQRAFAKAFRAMQLESTLFGILVPCVAVEWLLEHFRSSVLGLPCSYVGIEDLIRQ